MRIQQNREVKRIMVYGIVPNGMDGEDWKIVTGLLNKANKEQLQMLLTIIKQKVDTNKWPKSTVPIVGSKSK